MGELETPDGATRPTVEVTVVHPAELNAEPVRPVVARNIAIGLVLGLLAGVCLALLRHRLDRRVMTSTHVRAATGKAPVAIVPRDPQLGRQPVAAAPGGSRSVRKPSWSSAAVWSSSTSTARPGSSSRPDAREGRTTLAVNLATALGQSGHRVLLIDADLGQPNLAPYVGVPGRPGLADVLSGTATLDDVTQPWEDGKVTVLPAGATPGESREGMPSTRMRALLRTVRASYDYVVLDAPPLLVDSDAALLSALADGCVLTARYKLSRVDQLAEAMAMLSRVDAAVLGVVLNGVPGSAAAARPRQRRWYAVLSEATVAPSTADPAMLGPGRRSTRPADGGLVPAARSENGWPAT